MAKTYLGYLLIADISGYTVYLKESELEHAQETLTRLLEVLVDHTRPPCNVLKPNENTKLACWKQH